jgi:RNA polymerase sigma-70 factor (ECF subfamily)
MNQCLNPGNGSGPFDARYLAFLETITHLRPRLHRYCARMTGSVMDGEDVVQDSLFNAYRRLETLQDDRPLAPWLFQIAHNRCIDFIRRRDVRTKAETDSARPEFETANSSVSGIAVDHAIEQLVLTLPPKERACVLLKEVFDYSLEEIASIVDSTSGGVKAALHRARTKLDSPSLETRQPVRQPHPPEVVQILRLYVERFNQRDWEGVRELIAADARLLVADRFAGPLANAPYFSRYAAVSYPWRFDVAEVDDELALVAMRLQDSIWTTYSIARVEVYDGSVQCVVDYAHCDWVLSLAGSVVVSRI